MRKVLFAAAGLAALSAAGFAFAQDTPQGRQFGIFQADANNDGTVTRAEFDAHRAARFAALDANNDGQLTREEMRAGHSERRGGHRGMHRLDRADANNDGQISRAEFAAMGAAMFERLDANSDGRVTREEAQAARGHRHGR